MNKCTLIIDGNWLLMSRLGIMMNDFNKDQDQQQLEAARDNMVDFVAQSINKMISFWGDRIDNIMMVQDGGSWRKHFEKPSFIHDEYKGNRVSSAEVAWDYVWMALDTICKKFHENNITCVSEHNVEGDDWCWYWSRYLNHEGTNCIIWSSDADLKQLVQLDASGAWTVWFNDKAGLFVPDIFNISDMDILMGFRGTDAFLEDICKRSQKYTYINPDDIVMEKVICGDKGDNIRPLLQFKNHTSTGKAITRCISPKEWGIVKKKLQITDITMFKDHKDNVLEALLDIPRFKGHSVSKTELSELFDYNLVMVRLHKEQIPKGIQLAMNKHRSEYKVTDMDYLRHNYKVLTSQSEKVETLFEGLPF